MVCFSKPDGLLRVCIDFRKVNKDIVFDSYPMHRIDEQLENMAGARFFTTLDLTKGYHQMVINDKSKEFTAFITLKGFFQWKVLPMEIKTLGAVFQRLMDKLKGELQPRCVVVYIDYITIFSKDMDQY